MAASLVQVSNVTKNYQRDDFNIKVLAGITLDVQEGEFVALMGPSGSGKSTLLNLLAGIDRPTLGQVHIAGQELGALSDSQLARWRHRSIGFVFQFYHLIPVLTAFENIELPLTLTNLTKNQRKRKVEVALQLVGLKDRMHHYPRQLSGGQEQRVAIARAVVTDPKLILADEPTGDLDAASADEVLNLLTQLNQEFAKTIVMVTHDPRVALKASREVHLDKGLLTQKNQNPKV